MLIVRMLFAIGLIQLYVALFWVLPRIRDPRRCARYAIASAGFALAMSLAAVSLSMHLQ